MSTLLVPYTNDTRKKDRHRSTIKCTLTTTDDAIVDDKQINRHTSNIPAYVSLDLYIRQLDRVDTNREYSLKIVEEMKSARSKQ
jgi:hypothetical protein